MTHLTARLPATVEQGAIRKERYSTDIVETDGGNEVRNARWAEPLRTWEVSFPTSNRNDPTYLSVKSLFRTALGSLHTFEFADWAEYGAIRKVRFDSSMQITGIDIRLDHIDTLTLVEVR